MCGLVPLIILLLNVLVIAETRRLLDQQKQLTYSVRLVGTKTTSTPAAAMTTGPQADVDSRTTQVYRPRLSGICGSCLL